ncbi:MAG: DUF177 domain-containing protein [Chloroflexi bacterium]|nr:DUF177 domain-containing protein [Chloroflexota bacterium]
MAKEYPIKGSSNRATPRGYLSKRLLRVNVGFLLSEGPGNAREIPIEFAQRVQVDDDLYLAALTGRLLFTRTKEGILVQGNLNIARERECDRCLDAYEQRFGLDIAELFASPPDANNSAFSVDGNGEIDLAPLLREEVLIEASYRAVCREDCLGLNAETGEKLPDEREIQQNKDYVLDHGTEIDPRLAVLKQLL